MTADSDDACVLCGRPMDGAVNELHVRVGGRLLRACDEECPPRTDDPALQVLERRREAAAIDEQIRAKQRAMDSDGADVLDHVDDLLALMDQHSRLLGLYAPRQVEVGAVDPPTASDREVVEQVRADLRREDEASRF